MDPYELGQLQETIRAAIIDGLKQDESAARLVRIDAAARAVFAASFNGVDLLSCNWSDTVIDLRCRVAYEFALALERARDEAVKDVK